MSHSDNINNIVLYFILFYFFYIFGFQSLNTKVCTSVNKTIRKVNKHLTIMKIPFSE